MKSHLKYLGGICLFLVAAGAAFPETAPRYSEVEFDLSRVSIQEVGELGIAVDHNHSLEEKVLRVPVTDQERKLLAEKNIPYRLLIEDMAKFYEDRLKADLRMPLKKEGGTTVSPPENFRQGSMGGYLTYNEITGELDRMRNLFPSLISAKIEAGKSLENRSIWAVRISNNPNTEQNRPKVYYDAMIHSREPMGMMNLIYFAWHLLESYATDAGVKRLLDNVEIYILPIVNPDGYEFNRGSNPTGGGMWRKNRRQNADGSRGVDCNRNFSVSWSDNSGNSTTPSSDAYRGTEPFSEPETRAVRDFVNARKPYIMMTYHTYANKIIHPYGDGRYPANRAEYEAIARELVRTTSWPFGPVPPMVGYKATGVTTDWVHDVVKSFAFGAELGASTDGFWPRASRITPLADLVLETNLALARAALPASTRLALPSRRITGQFYADMSATAGRLNFRYELTDASQSWFLTVSDMQGRQHRQFRLSPSENAVSLAQRELPRSLYVLEVKACGSGNCRSMHQQKLMLGGS